jgi:hypothetical protein
MKSFFLFRGLVKIMNIQEAKDYQEIKVLIAQGHTRHCACRQIYGDGICTCTRTGEITMDKEKSNI